MPRDVRNPVLASLACALMLIPVVVLAYAFGPGERLDGSIFSHLAAHDSGAGHALAVGVGSLGDLLPVLAMLALIVTIGLAAGRGRQALAAVVIVVGAGLTTQVLKHLLSHPRFQGEFLGLDHPWANSFPSGHTTAAASLAAALLFVVPPRLRPVAAGLGATFTTAMGIAVVVLQWHYPSDVVGALLVVGSWSFVALAALRLLRPRGPASPPRERRESSSGRFAISLQ
ncbi:MAG TPA: phosphatase PAP2 family protein [Solirubrobacterales bacterium]|nr:phosphatase PAP2 family protein [Solirubrobacterales bacterium]